MRYILLFVILSFGIWACQPEEACVSSATSQVVIDFFRPDPIADTIVRDTIPFMRIYSTSTLDEDFSFWEDTTAPIDSVFRVQVALNPDLDQTKIVFVRENVANDTLILGYERRYRLISPECPLEVSYQALRVVSTTFSDADVINRELQIRSPLQADVQVLISN